MNLTALESEHFSDVVQSDAVGIAVDEKKRGLIGLEPTGPSRRGGKGRNTDNLAYLFRMVDGDLHRHAAAHAVTEQIGLLALEVIEYMSRPLTGA